MIILIALVWVLGAVVWGFPVLSVALSVLTLSGGGVVGVFLMLAATVAFQWLSMEFEDGRAYALYILVSLAACTYTFQWWALAWLVGFVIIQFGNVKLWW